MSSDLVMRMRTCAAAILSSKDNEALVVVDAANLLVEASNLLDVEEPLGEVMQALEPVVRDIYRGGGVWTGVDLPAAVPRPCPACGNVAARKVRITNTKLLLTCPMCSHEWEYAP